jgi:hypothetical protein
MILKTTMTRFFYSHNVVLGLQRHNNRLFDATLVSIVYLLNRLGVPHNDTCILSFAFIIITVSCCCSRLALDVLDDVFVELLG